MYKAPSGMDIVEDIEVEEIEDERLRNAFGNMENLDSTAQDVNTGRSRFVDSLERDGGRRGAFMRTSVQRIVCNRIPWKEISKDMEVSWRRLEAMDQVDGVMNRYIVEERRRSRAGSSTQSATSSVNNQQSHPSLSSVIRDGQQVSKKVRKFWNERYQLFPNFDRGIWIDEEGLYSVTHHETATATARRFVGSGCRRVLDMFGGVGGNCIAFAQAGVPQVVSVELNEDRHKMICHNADISLDGPTRERLEVICGDTFEAVKSIQGVDGVFIDPPWGGVGYGKNSCLQSFRRPVSAARRLTDRVALKVPKSVTRRDVWNTFRIRFQLVEDWVQVGSKTVLKSKTVFFGPFNV